MTSEHEKEILEEQWMSDEWKAKANGEQDETNTPDESLTKEVLDAERKANADEDEFAYIKEMLQHDVPLPPPTLITLASGLASQAMVSMGVFPNPIMGKSVILLNQAAHLIGTIDLLKDKTQGNCTPEESKTLDGMLHELRMIYLAAQKQKNL